MVRHLKLLAGTAALALAAHAASAQTSAANSAAPAAAGPIVWDMDKEAAALAANAPVDPEFTIKGLPIGTGSPFALFADLAGDVSYDDNVYRVATQRERDTVFSAAPTLVLDYRRDGLHLDAYADGTINEYAKLSRVDNAEFDLGLRGSYAFANGLQTSANVSISQNAWALSSPDNVGNQARPTLFHDFNTSWQLKYQPGAIGFIIGYSGDIDRYLSVPLIGGGSQNLSTRNDNLYHGFVEGDYDFAPGYEAFIRATYNADDFQQFYDLGGEHRSSDGQQFDGGLKILLTNVIRGEVYLGYLANRYDAHQPLPLRDISGLDFGTSLTAFPTDQLTLHLSAQRALGDATLTGASAGDDKSVELNAEYALTRCVHLTANAGFDADLYEHAYLPSRTNLDLETISLGAGAKWFITHSVQASLTYLRSARSSSIPVSNFVPDFAFHDNLVMVGINLQS